MYEIRLINPLRQFGVVCWTLLFRDPADALPSFRIDKKFPDDAPTETICADIRASIVDTVFLLTQSPEAWDEDGRLLPREAGVLISLDEEVIVVDDVGGITHTWQI